MKRRSKFRSLIALRTFATVSLTAIICLSYVRPERFLRSGYLVVIDPGHGGVNIGAVTRGGLLEKDLTLAVGLRIDELLSNRGDVQVVLTRTDDRTMSLKDRRKVSNRNQADLFVSIHFNGSHNEAANRAEVFYSSKVSRQTAHTFHENIEAVVGAQNGLVEQVHWTVLWANRARLGAVLVEVMYLSHPATDNFLADEENLDAIAHGILRAVDTVLDTESHRRARRSAKGFISRMTRDDQKKLSARSEVYSAAVH